MLSLPLALLLTVHLSVALPWRVLYLSKTETQSIVAPFRLADLFHCQLLGMEYQGHMFLHGGIHDVELGGGPRGMGNRK